jgi:hypothetical protein
MNMSFAGTSRDAGVSVVKVSVRLIWELVRQVNRDPVGILSKAGEHTAAYVLDAQSRVIAHSDGFNFFQSDFSSLPQVRAARTGVAARDISGREVLIAYATVAAPDWTVFVEMPAQEADTLAQ